MHTCCRLLEDATQLAGRLLPLPPPLAAVCPFWPPAPGAPVNLSTSSKYRSSTGCVNPARISRHVKPARP